MKNHKIFSLLGITLLFCLLGVARVEAAQITETLTFTVNSTLDINDYVINSVCSANSVTGGLCTLRAAITEANANLPYGNVEILLPAGTYGLSIPPDPGSDATRGDLDFEFTTSTNTIILRGTGPMPSVIDANLIDRVMEVGGGVNLTLQNVVIRGGLLNFTGSSEAPGGAGIFNKGNLTLLSVRIEDNEARCGQTTCSQVIAGGGIYNLNGVVFARDTTIQNNRSITASAIFHTGNSTAGKFYLRNSSVLNNTASLAASIISYAEMSIRNSTLAGNTAMSDGSLCGIYNDAHLLIESSTFITTCHASIGNMTNGTVTIQDSILAVVTGSEALNCDSFAGLDKWTSLGYNVMSDDSCPFTATGDLLNTNPQLTFLANWGGPTQTIALLPGSPALNHRPGSCMVVPDFPSIPPNLPEDQRHFPRSDGNCDSGAFEGTQTLYPQYLPLIAR